MARQASREEAVAAVVERVQAAERGAAAVVAEAGAVEEVDAAAASKLRNRPWLNQALSSYKRRRRPVAAAVVEGAGLAAAGVDRAFLPANTP